MNGTPALAAAAPAMVRPWQRSRGAMWLSALLMVVLLAGFDLPTSPVGLAGPGGTGQLLGLQGTAGEGAGRRSRL